MGCVASLPQEYVGDSEPTTAASISESSKRSLRYRQRQSNIIAMVPAASLKPATDTPIDLSTQQEDAPSNLQSTITTTEQSSSLTTTRTLLTTTTQVTRSPSLPPLSPSKSDPTTSLLSSTESPSSPPAHDEDDVNHIKLSKSISHTPVSFPASVQARIAKFNRMDDAIIVKSNSTTTNTTSSSSSASSAVSGVVVERAMKIEREESYGDGDDEGEGDVDVDVVVDGDDEAESKENGIYEKIVEFERQAEETERLKTTIHKPNPNRQFKHADVHLHRLERARVFSSPAVST